MLSLSACTTLECLWLSWRANYNPNRGVRIYRTVCWCRHWCQHHTVCDIVSDTTAFQTAEVCLVVYFIHSFSAITVPHLVQPETITSTCSLKRAPKSPGQYVHIVINDLHHRIPDHPVNAQATTVNPASWGVNLVSYTLAVNPSMTCPNESILAETTLHSTLWQLWPFCFLYYCILHKQKSTDGVHNASIIHLEWSNYWGFWR